MIRSWLCELAARAFEADGNDLAGLEGWVEDSGEGRWTLEDAIDHGVPTPALSAALNSRFYSRAQGDYSARVLAALRNQFGGHAVQGERRAVTVAGDAPNPLAHGTRAAAGRRPRTSSSSARPATSRGASCCRRSTTWPTRASLPERFNLIGVSRGELTHDEYREIGGGVDPRVLAHAARTRPCSPALLDDLRYVAGLVRRPAGLRA